MDNIHIKAVPHGKQRYDTLGDWFYEADGALHIRVTQLGDWRMEFAIALHEMVEFALCRVAGISQQQVDDFDFGSDFNEPGDDPEAPYHREHVLATGIEYIVLALLGVDAKDYEAKCQRVIPDSMSSQKPGTALGSLVD